MRFSFDIAKSKRLRADPKRKIGFEEAQAIFDGYHYLDDRGDDPQQFRAIGWVGHRLYSLIFEVRFDKQGEFLHLVTLWPATREEKHLYEKSS